MKNIDRNAKVVFEKNGDKEGFNVYLDLSGQREFITVHKRYGMLYTVLKDGIFLSEMQRKKPIKIFHDHYGKNKRRATASFDNMMNHLSLVVNDYLAYRESC